jgi:hypothetical protein
MIIIILYTISILVFLKIVTKINLVKTAVEALPDLKLFLNLDEFEKN